MRKSKGIGRVERTTSKLFARSRERLEIGGAEEALVARLPHEPFVSKNALV